MFSALPLKKLNIDWAMFLAALPVLVAGLFTMNSFSGENYFFEKQLIWATVSVVVFFALSFFDFRFLRRTGVLVSLFAAGLLLLALIFALGSISGGAQSWFKFGGFSFQPSDPVKLLIILVLAKYFSKRHIEIKNIRHIIVSGIYAAVPAIMVFFQPDFGSAVIIFLIWFGMIMVSGVSKKHLFLVLIAGILAVSFLWFFGFTDKQKQRVVTFLNPLTDVRGAGYNAYQSTIAVGSGEVFGKGVGYGTQSRLEFLPEYETDFIFAAFAEEWGFVGVMILFFLFGLVIWRILWNAMLGETNFETFFGLGLAILFMSHFIVHVGMNMGLLPVTGLPMPFLSYGGSHLLTEFVGLGILMGMRRYNRAAHRDDIKNEFLGMAKSPDLAS